jgi:hypothetical protein
MDIFSKIACRRLLIISSGWPTNNRIVWLGSRQAQCSFSSAPGPRRLTALQQEVERQRITTELDKLQTTLDDRTRISCASPQEQEEEYERLVAQISQLQKQELNNYSQNTVLSAKQEQDLRELGDRQGQLKQERNDVEHWMQLDPEARKKEFDELQGERDHLQLLLQELGGRKLSTTGRYQQLVQRYGLPFLGWYWVVWSASGAVVYGAIEILGADAMLYIEQWDAWTGWGIQSHVDPEWGTIGLAVAMNEILEPLRLPFVLVTVKPLIDTLRVRK